MEKVENVILTKTGKEIDIENPKLEDIVAEDIIVGLSNLCRYNGHTKRFYSVAEHSIYCAEIARHLGLPSFHILRALLHDASEAYVGDCIRPLKQNLPLFSKYEDKFEEIIYRSFDIYSDDEEIEEDINKVIKAIDNTVLHLEMKSNLTHHEVERHASKISTFNLDYSFEREIIKLMNQKEMSLDVVRSGFMSILTQTVGDFLEEIDTKNKERMNNVKEKIEKN